MAEAVQPGTTANRDKHLAKMGEYMTSQYGVLESMAEALCEINKGRARGIRDALNFLRVSKTAHREGKPLRQRLFYHVRLDKRKVERDLDLLTTLLHANPALLKDTEILTLDIPSFDKVSPLNSLDGMIDMLTDVMKNLPSLVTIDIKGSASIATRSLIDKLPSIGLLADSPRLRKIIVGPGAIDFIARCPYARALEMRGGDSLQAYLPGRHLHYLSQVGSSSRIEYLVYEKDLDTPAIPREYRSGLNAYMVAYDEAFREVEYLLGWFTHLRSFRMEGFKRTYNLRFLLKRIRNAVAPAAYMPYLGLPRLEEIGLPPARSLRMKLLFAQDSNLTFQGEPAIHADSALKLARLTHSCVHQLRNIIVDGYEVAVSVMLDNDAAFLYTVTHPDGKSTVTQHPILDVHDMDVWYDAF